MNTHYPAVPEPPPPKFTNAEYERGHDAWVEFDANGQTSLRCLRCDNEFVFDKRGNSLEIKCKTDGCIVERIRGI